MQFFRQHLQRTIVSLATLLYLSLAGVSWAEISIYTVENQVQAAFPSTPIFIAEVDTGFQTLRNYQALDVETGISFSVLWQTGGVEFSSDDISAALRNLALGDALGVNGELLDYTETFSNDRYGAEYQVHYEIEGSQTKKFVILSYSNGRSFSWSVSEVVGVSKNIGASVFASYKSFFKALDAPPKISGRELAQRYVNQSSLGLPIEVGENVQLVNVAFSKGTVVRKYVFWEIAPEVDDNSGFDEKFKLFWVTHQVADLKEVCTDRVLKKLLWSGIALREEMYDINRKLFHSAEFNSSMCPNKY